MRRLLLALPLLLTAPLIAQAPTAAPGTRNPALVTGGSYTVDPEHTLIEWQVDHLGITPYFGLFGQVTGTLELDPKNPNAARVDVRIPVSNVTTASAGLTEHLLRAPGLAGGKPDFFGAAPADARFVSTRVVARGQQATITGNLTLNGVTRPVTLQARFYGAGKLPAQMGGGENVGFEATASLKRSDFGLGFSVPLVGDQVTLKIAAAFVKEPAAPEADGVPIENGPAQAEKVGAPSGEAPAAPQQPPAPPLNQAGSATGGCGATKAAPFVGRKATRPVRAAVAKAVGRRPIRWIAPGVIVTKDLRPERLNMELDWRDIILGARCG